MFCEKDVLRNFTKFSGNHLCQSLFFNKVAGLRPKACNFVKKETLAQVFPCEFCEISKNTFLHRTPLVAASAPTLQSQSVLRPRAIFPVADRKNSFYCIVSTLSKNKNVLL